ncbi:hypothetical protein [Mesorhizobium koreense]|uniref:hypothetical protein n=1 Tax=Mesorhizobium koreense TaxID=3074855 RepID=UPI00287BBC98|nr:hypothetical protein [Mesorhizobium sp. WR6]
MAQWDIALVLEQGVDFAVASVQDHVIDNHHTAEGLVAALSVRLGRPAVLLGAQRHRLYGRQDIVRFLQSVDPARLPWRRMEIAS